MKPRELIRLLQRHGFSKVRQVGSHKQFRHFDGRATTVPCHGGRDVDPTLIRVIAREIGLDIQEFLNP